MGAAGSNLLNPLRRLAYAEGVVNERWGSSAACRGIEEKRVYKFAAFVDYPIANFGRVYRPTSEQIGGKVKLGRVGDILHFSRRIFPDAYYSLFAALERLSSSASNSHWRANRGRTVYVEALVNMGFEQRGVRGRLELRDDTFSGGRERNPSDDPMNRKDAMLNLRQVLIKRRDALRKALAGDLSLLKELKGQTSGDVIDAALDSVQDEISSQLAEVESRELVRIEVALERMRNGQYGVCETCGTNIPMARLNALPYATSCIKCQREAEREGGSGSGDVDWSRLLDSGAHDADLTINDIELDVS